MRTLRFFVWTLVPFAAVLIYLWAGMPHVLFSYTWRDDGQGSDPFAKRHYISCTHIGPFGEITLHAWDGRCRFIHFWKKRS